MTRRRAHATAALAIVLGVLSASGSARASGFLLYEQSAAGLGMASAVSASTLEPAAVFYNPAALVFMDGVQASLAGTAYFGHSEFTPEGGGDAVSAKPIRQLVPGVFAMARLSDRIALGLAVSVPFGLGVEWPHDWSGRQYAIKSDLLVADVNPVVAVKLVPQLSLAAGLDVLRGTVDISRGLPTGSADSLRIAGAGFAVGGNVAVLYRIVPDRVHAALTYRSRAKLEFDGRAHFIVSEPVFTRQLFDQKGNATLVLPDSITLGVMVRPVRTLRLELDADAVLWSTYDRVPIHFSSPATPNSELRPNYHDVVDVRAGAEWSLPVDGLAARLGFMFDPNPAPASGLSPAVPDANRVNMSAGIGYHRAEFGADLGYMLVLFLPSKARAPSDPDAAPQAPAGTFRTTAHLLGLTLTGRYGAK